MEEGESELGGSLGKGSLFLRTKIFLQCNNVNVNVNVYEATYSNSKVTIRRLLFYDINVGSE